MSTVTLSPKYQVVIPKDIRERLKLNPGQKLQLIQIGDRMELIPLLEMKKARGFLKGMKTDFKREGDRV